MTTQDSSAPGSAGREPLSIGIALVLWLPILLALVGHQAPHLPSVAAILIGSSIGAWWGRRRTTLMVLGSMLGGCVLLLVTTCLAAAVIDPSTFRRSLLWLPPAGTVGAALGFAYGLTVAVVQWAICKARRHRRPS